MPYQVVKNKLVSILTPLIAENKAGQVDDHFEADIDSFPAIQIDIFPSGSSRESRVDDITNMNTAFFLIHIVLSQDNTSINASDRISILSDVLDKLRTTANIDTLGGVCEMFSIENIQPFAESEGDSAQQGIDILVSAGKLKAIS